jgi:hypothetical protein
MRYDKPILVERYRLNNPMIDDIEIVKERPVGDGGFLYDAVVVEQRGDTLIINSSSFEKNVFEFVSTPLNDRALPYSSIGLSGTRLDITLLIKGFYYDNRIWYPTAKRNAFIICSNNKIIGYNVKYVNKNLSK